MPQFCAACGAQMPDGATACPSCKRPIAQSTGGGAAAAPAPSAASGNDNIIALLCWSPVAIVGIIMGLAVEPYNKSKLVRFHAFEALFTFLAMFAISIAFMILGVVLSFVGPLALVMLPLWFVFWIGSIVLFVFMMVKAYQGQMTRLPFVGELAAKQAGV